MFWMFCFLLYFQLVSIITDETPIEQMRNRLMIKDRGSSSSSSTTHSSQLPHHPTHTRKPKLALLREVFGRGWHIISHEHAESKAPMVACQSFHVKLLCRLLQVQSFAGSFRFTPTPHLLAASPTLPSLTMTSDFGLRVKSKKKKSCFCVWVTIRAWIFTAQLWRLILRPVRWRGREEKSGLNVSTQWTDQWLFFSSIRLKSISGLKGIICVRQMLSYLERKTYFDDLSFLIILTGLKCLPGVWLMRLTTAFTTLWHCCSPTFLIHLNCQFIPRIWRQTYLKRTLKKNWPNLHKEKLLICTGCSQTWLSSKCSFFEWWETPGLFLVSYTVCFSLTLTLPLNAVVMHKRHKVTVSASGTA